MSPIPPPDRRDKPLLIERHDTKDKVREAIEDLLHGAVKPTGVIAHPSLTMADLQQVIDELNNAPPVTLTAGKPWIPLPPLSATPQVSGPLPPRAPGQLLKAYEKAVADAKVKAMDAQVTGRPIMAAYEKSSLERQLEESLWAKATLHTPVFTQDDLQRHLGPGHLEGEMMVKRVFDKHVLVLCPCMMMLEMNHCEGPPYAQEGSARCQEPVVGAALCAQCRSLL